MVQDPVVPREEDPPPGLDLVRVPQTPLKDRRDRPGGVGESRNTATVIVLASTIDVRLPEEGRPRGRVGDSFSGGYPVSSVVDVFARSS